MREPLIGRIPSPFRHGARLGRLKLSCAPLTREEGRTVTYYWIGWRVRHNRPLRHRLDAAFWQLALRLSPTAVRREQAWRQWLDHDCSTPETHDPKDI